MNSQTGQGVAAAQVFIGDLDIGVLSQATGRYQLQNVPVGTHRLTAELIGYRSVSAEVTVGAGTSVVHDFQITVQALGLDEIVVTGTAGGTQRRAIGNLVERVSAADVAAEGGATSVQQMLSNRLPGVTTGLFAGGVGNDGGVIRIRGVSSMGVSNDPIVFVDGIRMNSAVSGFGGGNTSRLNDIQPEDIESIEVIKGPAAATLYGTEASNGVIQIITKRGTQGAPSFDASVETGVNWLTDPRGKIGSIYEIDGSGNIFSANLWDTELETTGNPIFTKGLIQNYSLAVQGGTDLVRYFASLNYLDQEGYVSWNTEQRTSGRVGLDVTANEAVTIQLNGSFHKGAARSAGSNIWRTIMSAQLVRLDDPLSRGFGLEKPEDLRDGQEDRLDVDRQTWSLQLGYRPVDWLQARAVVGTDLTSEVSTFLTYREPNAPNGIFGSNGLGQKSIDEVDTRINTLDVSTTATFRFMGDGRLGTATSAGVQYYEKVAGTQGLEGDEFATRALTTIGSAGRTTSSESFVENKTLGVYVQEQFDWAERIFLTAAVRGDANSAFGEQFDAAIYPKLSATWIVHEEGFWADRVSQDLIGEFRLRGAWGKAGQQPDAFAATTLYQTRPGPGGVEFTPQTLGNAELGPEVGSEVELGFDVSGLGGRVSLGYTHYWRKTTDAITPVDLTPSLGYPGTQLVNIGQVSNWGNELTMDVQVLDGARFAWGLGVAAGTMKNRVDDLGDADGLLVNGNSGQFHVEGYPLAGQWVPRVVFAEFVSGTSGSVNEATSMCDGGTETRVGQFAGPAGGASVPCADAPLVYMGRSGEPTWNLALSSTLRLFQNWRLFASVDARGGDRRFSQAEAARATTWANVPAAVYQTDPLFMRQRALNRVGVASYDAGFARLREVSLTYTAPTTVAGRLGMSAASVTFSARNLGLLWQEQKNMDLSGIPVVDPEARSPGTGFDGHNHTQAPPQSQAMINVRFSF